MYLIKTAPRGEVPEPVDITDDLPAALDRAVNQYDAHPTAWVSLGDGAWTTRTRFGGRVDLVPASDRTQL